MPKSVVDALREAVERLEQTSEFQSGDADVLKLRQEINEAIAKFHAAQKKSASPETDN